MKRIITLVVILLVVCGSSLARRVPEERALGYARNWWLQKDGPRSAVLEPVATEFQNIYLFVDTAGRGFVMLSADDRSIPVLGYSLSNGFVADSTMPAAVHDWVQDYNDQIQFLIDNNIEKTAEINEQWKDLNNQQSQLPQAYPTAKGPLIQSNWGQGTPFNNYCPSNYTGCVATAMAQIMNYYEFPNRGIGTNTYIPYYFTTPITVNFADSAFDWANMLDSYTYDYDQSYPYPPLWNETQANAVARLMKCVGVAVDMSYAPVSSSYASSAKTISANYDEPSAVNAYKKYFKYKWTVRGVCQADYSNEDWKALLKNEIDNDRPMQYGGANTGASGGHSFICDGYDTNGKFHFNWGGAMGGIRYTEYGGYYEVSDINKYDEYGSEKFGYNLNKYAIIGIEPDDTASTTSTITVTATSNNTAWGTVTGGGTFTKYSQTVTLTPVANEGYKFIGWSNGSREVPLKFLANGDDAALVANFAPVNGELLYYCNGACIATYGSYGSTKFWGIRIPASSLDQGSKLTDIEFFASIPDTYTISVYEGDFETGSVVVSPFSVSVSKYNSWIKASLATEWNIDNTEDLCVAIESRMCAASMSAATSNASFETDDPQYGWTHKLNAGGKDVAWCIKAITLTPGTPHSITINQNAVILTTISQNVDLNSNGGLAVSNKGATVMYELISCTPNGIATMDPDDTHITTTGVGTVRIRAYANHAQYGLAEHIVDLTVGRGTLEFTKPYGYWSDPTNWSPLNIVPDSVNHDVLINKVCYVADGQQCHDLSFGTFGTLYVESEAVLNVSGELDNSDPTSLVIKSDENNSGTVIFKSGSPKATVEMYMKGTIGTDGKDPDWQLRGCVVDDFETVDGYFYHYWNNVHAYEWDETNNANGCWDDTRMDGLAISLEPWKGYGFANYSTSPVTVEYKGTLINSDHTWTLTKTGSGNANVGANLLTNSYSAPIEISELQFENAQSYVILYNTGSLVDWQRYNGNLSNSGTSPGQYLVCPVVTSPAADLPTAIPSGQSFYVVANQDGATVSISYKDVVKATSGPLFAPAEEEQFNVLGVRITGESGGDRAVLIECASCSDDYDDGYDGMKYFGNAALPQLYVVNDFGNTSINASESIVGKRLGVHTSDKGKRLTMVFETDKLSGYSQLKLKDLKTGMYADILSGREYQFTTTGDDDARFEVVGFAEDDDDEQLNELTIAGNTLYVGKFAGRVRMYDMSGKIVWHADVRENEWFELPELLHGVYVIKADNATIKIVK